MLSLIFIFLLSFISYGNPDITQTQNIAPKSIKPFTDTLKVAVYNSPPCVFLNESGDPTGFDIELLEKIAKKSKLIIKYQYKDNFTDLLPSVIDSICDAAISGITITGNREDVVDFSHPYLNSGLMICVDKNSKINPFKVLIRYINNMGPMLLLILFFTLCCGVLIYYIEKKYSKKESMFSPEKPSIGIFHGFYFSNIFSSTVGFGDFVPKSIPGKCVTIVLIIIGVYFIFPYAVANMNMALTQETEIYDISSPDDFPGKKIATEDSTTSISFLKKTGCNLVLVESINDAYELLKENKIDAVVYDMPFIKYFVKNAGKKRFRTSGAMFDKQTYGIALKKESPFREILNKNIVDFMRTSEYWELHDKWFGD